MADKDAATPRIYLIRHGATEWSQSGKFTGISDIPLLPSGEDKIRQTAAVVFGEGKLINPSSLVKVFCSPRVRATRTLELLFQAVGKREILPEYLKTGVKANSDLDVEVTESIAEWGYGDYEGLLTKEIRALRKERGHDLERPWNIWVDGTEGEGSEKPESVRDRLDAVIEQIVSIHKSYLADAKDGKFEKGRKRDVLIIAHGHILRAFIKRWLNLDLGINVDMMLEPGGVCGLSYAHGNVEERAMLAGMAFPQPTS